MCIQYAGAKVVILFELPHFALAFYCFSSKVGICKACEAAQTAAYRAYVRIWAASVTRQMSAFHGKPTSLPS